MAAPDAQGRSARVIVRPLRRRDRAAAMRRLADRTREELFLLDLVVALGGPHAVGDVAPELLGA